MKNSEECRRELRTKEPAQRQQTHQWPWTFLTDPQNLPADPVNYHTDHWSWYWTQVHFTDPQNLEVLGSSLLLSTWTNLKPTTSGWTPDRRAVGGATVRVLCSFFYFGSKKRIHTHTHTHGSTRSVIAYTHTDSLTGCVCEVNRAAERGRPGLNYFVCVCVCARANAELKIFL